VPKRSEARAASSAAVCAQRQPAGERGDLGGDTREPETAEGEAGIAAAAIGASGDAAKMMTVAEELPVIGYDG
jgi:hypothetical protein